MRHLRYQRYLRENVTYFNLVYNSFPVSTPVIFCKKNISHKKCKCDIFRYLEKNMRYLRFCIYRGFGISWPVEGITIKSISFLHFRETRRAGRKSQKEEIYSSKHTRVQTGTDKADTKQKYKSSMISARHSCSSWIDFFPHFPRRVKEMHLIFQPCLFLEARRRCLKKDFDLVFHISWYSGSWPRFLVQKD